MPINRAFKPLTIDKFNGMNTALSGSVPEEYSQDDQELADITNFNTNTDGFLEKRKGATILAAITSPVTPTSLRIIYLQRTRVGTLANRLFVTDGTRTWRVTADSGAVTHITNGGGANLGGLQSMVEYGGTATSTAYNCTGVRWINTQDTTTPGLIGFYGDSTIDQTSWQANTPLGTQMALFKNRGWVINSLGRYNSSGYETKVWYSNPGALADFGGAAMNNFNLDFGDGDYLVTMLPYNDQMFFFKTRKTYMVSADGPPANWQYRLISDRIGCVGRGTVKVINNIIYFLSVDGVVRTDGVTFQNISTPVRDLFDTYRDYYRPETALNLYASHWDDKYILWMPSSDSLINTALVFNVLTETWTRWRFVGGVTALGDALWDEHYPETLFFGSSGGNSIWQLGQPAYRDNLVTYDCSFRTKKYDFGSAMKRKRNHLVGLSTADSSPTPGTYTIQTTADDTTVTSRVETTGRQAAMNIKARGAGYGRYFQTAVTQTSTQYAAVYDLTWMNEERSFESKSSPVKNT